MDAEHATYWSDGWAIGRSTEGVAPASTWYLAEGAVGGFEAYLAVFSLEPVPVRLALTFYISVTAGARAGRGGTRGWPRGRHLPRRATTCPLALE